LKAVRAAVGAPLVSPAMAAAAATGHFADIRSLK
jgi:homoaconitase/3-isopropylmalate dehydratase large subunit